MYCIDRLMSVFCLVKGGPKNCTPTVSQQIVQQRVPVKLVLSDLTVTHRSIACAHNIQSIIKYSVC